jgi:hypothetical protein
MWCHSPRQSVLGQRAWILILTHPQLVATVFGKHKFGCFQNAALFSAPRHQSNIYLPSCATCSMTYSLLLPHSSNEIKPERRVGCFLKPCKTLQNPEARKTLVADMHKLPATLFLLLEPCRTPRRAKPLLLTCTSSRRTCSCSWWRQEPCRCGQE